MSSENACVKATFGLKNGQGMVSDFPIERFVATESVIDDYVAPTSEDNFQRMFKDNLQLIFTNFEVLFSQ